MKRKNGYMKKNREGLSLSVRMKQERLENL